MKLKNLLAAVGLTCFLYAASAAPLQSINIAAEGRIPPAVAEELLGDYIGRPIDAALLQKVLNEVSRYYRAHGYPNSVAYLPEQLIEEGVILVRVLSPQVTDVQVSNRAGLRPAAVRRLFARLDGEDPDLGNQDVMAGRLLNLTDLGVFDLDGYYEQLDDAEEVALHLTAAGRGRWGGTVFADNYGTKAAGRYRAGGALQARNLSGNADTLSVFYARSDEAQNNYSANYELPVNGYPTVVGVTACAATYELAGAYKALGATGRSYNAEAYVRQPWYRTGTARASVTGGVRYRRMTDKFERFDVAFRKHAWAGYAETRGALRHGAWDAGGSARLTVGKLYADDQWGVTDDHNFAVANLTGDVSYTFAPQWAVRDHLELQLSGAELDANDQLQASGAQAVRAFAPTAAVGDRGLLNQLSLQFTPVHLPDVTLTLAPHADFGTVRNHDGFRRTLGGVGVSAAVQVRGLFAEATLDRAVGARHRGDDAYKFWLRVGYQFS